MARGLVRWLYGIVLVTALVGCANDAEDACEEICEYASRCEDLDAHCSEARFEECTDWAGTLSSGCQDAMADAYSCINSVDSCDEIAVEQECGSEIGDYLEECAGDGVRIDD